MKNSSNIKRIYASTLKPQSNTGNLGDIFGYLLTEKLISREIQRTGIPDKANIDSQTILLVGSILNHIKPNKNALIYGPGFIKSDVDPTKLKGNRVAGVRGKLSKKIIEHAFPNSTIKVCSDPGLLIRPLMAPHFEVAQKSRVGAIIHSVDRAQYLQSSFNHIPIVEHYKGIDHFLKSISTYTHIISTSLHGMIFCHSLGIPVIPVVISNKITGGSFKFNDYLSSVKISIKERMMMLHEAPRQEEKLMTLIGNHQQPSKELVDKLTKRQIRQIKKLIRNPSEAACL